VLTEKLYRQVKMECAVLKHGGAGHSIFMYTKIVCKQFIIFTRR
jgi:hypothetical protein